MPQLYCCKAVNIRKENNKMDENKATFTISFTGKRTQEIAERFSAFFGMVVLIRLSNRNFWKSMDWIVTI